MRLMLPRAKSDQTVLNDGCILGHNEPQGTSNSEHSGPSWLIPAAMTRTWKETSTDLFNGELLDCQLHVVHLHQERVLLLLHPEKLLIQKYVD